MTARTGTTSIDGTPISATDLARIAAEEQLHSEQQRSAVRVVAASALDAEDCRTLLAMLGINPQIVAEARGHTEAAPKAAAKRSRKRSAAA
jgi:hypothetical protein